MAPENAGIVAMHGAVETNTARPEPVVEFARKKASAASTEPLGVHPAIGGQAATALIPARSDFVGGLVWRRTLVFYGAVTSREDYRFLILGRIFPFHGMGGSSRCSFAVGQFHHPVRYTFGCAGTRKGHRWGSRQRSGLRRE